MWTDRRWAWAGLRPVLLAMALIGAMALTLTACGSDDDTGGEAETSGAVAQVKVSEDIDLAGEKLRFGDLGTGSINKALLEASGQLDDVPYDIEWSLHAAGPQLIEAQRGGSVDIGWMASTPAIFAQAGRAPIKIVAASRLAPNKTNVAILVPADSDIRTVADLEGKKVGVTQGTIMQYLLVDRLERAGLHYKDIKPALLPLPDGLAALKNDSIDAWVTLEPFQSIAQAQGDYRVLDGSRMGSFNVVVAHDDLLGDPTKEALIADFLIRLARAQEWANEHPEAAGRAYAKATRLPAPVGIQVQKRQPVSYVPIDDRFVREQQQQADAFAELGIIPGKLDVEKEFDLRFNDVVSEATGD